MAKQEEQDKELKFEEALEKLEAIVAEMESGELSLEDSMDRFEKGMKLSKLCSDKLGETEKKIELLLKKAGGDAEWEELDAPR